MSITNITNGESGSSVRGKLNSVIDEVSPIEAAAEGSVFQKGLTVNEALSREDFGRQKEVFNNSFVGTSLMNPFVSDWGNTVNSNSDNGKTFLNNTTRPAGGAQDYKIILLDAPQNSIKVLASGIANQTGTRNINFAFYIDDLNYYEVYIVKNEVKINEVIAGTRTQIYSYKTFLNQGEPQSSPSSIYDGQIINAEVTIVNISTKLGFQMSINGEYIVFNHTVLAAFNIAKVGLTPWAARQMPFAIINKNGQLA